MAKYKLIFFDLDGTLLTSNYELLPSTLKAIEDIRGSGLKVSVATGRSYKSAKPFLDKLNITEPVVLYNGSALRYPQAPKTKVISGIPRQNAMTIFQLLSDFKVSAKAHLGDGTLYKLDDTPWPDEGEYFEVGIIDPSIKETLKEDPVKIVVYGLFEKAETFESELKQALGEA